VTEIRKILPLFVLLLIGLSAHAVTWTTLDVPGSTSTEPLGMNDAGDVVGSYSNGHRSIGFLYSEGIFTKIRVPGAVETTPYGINDNGQIAGVYKSDDSKVHGFFFDGQTFTTLDFPGAAFTDARGINNAVTIAGTYVDASGQNHGFSWNNGTFTTLDKIPPSSQTVIDSINNRGDIVGVYLDAGLDFRGFILSADGALRTLKFLGVQNMAINDRSTVVGTFFDSSNGFKYRLKTKALEEIHFPHSAGTYCFGINNTRQIVGFYQTGRYHLHGYIRTP